MEYRICSLSNHIIIYSTAIYKSCKSNLLNFYLRRVVKIFPALMVLLVILFLLTQLLVGIKVIGYIDSALWSSIFLSNISYYLTSGYFDCYSETNLLLHTLSLSVQWQFYIIYPILLIIFYKVLKGRKSLNVGIYVITTISIICCIIYSRYN